MGKRGERADLARLPLGRNVESIARASNPPVLVVSRAFRPIHRALVAFDLDEGCTAAVDALANAKIVPPMPVLLLHVGQQGEDMRTGLAAAANRLEQAGFDASIELAPGEPQRVIPERAVTSATDLVIMGAFGRSRLKSLIFGSLTSEVVRGTQTPVLLAS
jgi:nucleotide-binding universal stress UspA family protein